MKAVILCGGKGTRIRDANTALPKPLLPIGEMPIVWHIMKAYSHYGIKDFILCLGYKGEAFKDFFLNYHIRQQDFTIDMSTPGNVCCLTPTDIADWRITLADTGQETLTGGRVARVRKYLEGEEHFCLTYGDGLADVDVPALLAQHIAMGKACTISAVRVTSRFGEVAVANGVVSEFIEKPKTVQERINGGFMVMDNRRIWDYLSEDASCILEQDVLPALMAKGEMAAFEHDGFWQCMDSPREYQLLNDLWATGEAPWKVW